MRMCQTADGSWLLGSHTGKWNQGSVTTRQYILRSVDAGQSWQVSPDRSPHGWVLPAWERLEEGRPLHLGNNRVLLLLRTPEGRLWEMRSPDAGRSWNEPQPTTLAHPDAPPMLFHLTDGKTLLALFHNKQKAGSMTHQYRTELWTTVSTDDGRTWSEPRFLLANSGEPARLTGWSGSSPMVSYCDVLVDAGELHLFIDHQVRQVLHVRLRETDLKELPTYAGLQQA